MINHLEADIQAMFLHFIGNYNEQEGCKFTDAPVTMTDTLREAFRKYFFDNFTEPSYYNFTFSDGNIEMNPLFLYARTIFENPESLGELSQTISKYLYDNSKHPNIKSGDFMVALVNNLLIDDEMVDAICLFKSENKQAFITLEQAKEGYKVGEEYGINAGKIDKACLIFNTDEGTGYKICAMDKSNKAKDAQFWMNDFLNVTPRSDDYHHTKNYIHATKAFIKDRLQPLYEIDKTQEAEILNRSKEYLSSQDDFDSGTYQKKVFNDEKIAKEFEFFREDYKEERKIELEDNFTVNKSAVKNYSKVFKSVLKLDKNFHVYIHGNREYIEKGTDETGRKFYKLFYEEEL